ncbi:MAG TPA: ATP-grasp domain-containing protein [Jatrophihabitans sp.]|nr:ATP-grasp domain-containing protein [Jatrophihabitans sp.]
MLNVLMVRYSPYWTGELLSRAGSAYLVADKYGANMPAGAEAQFTRVYRISSYDSVEELSAVAADLITRGVRIDKVASYAEFTQYAAGYLAHLLGLSEPASALAMNTRDKRLMKLRAAEASLRVPRTFSIPDLTAPDLDALEAAVDYPLVVKPASGWGTTSTLRVGTRAELLDALQVFAFEDGVNSHQLIAEEFIEGDEYHVDAVWRDGEPWAFFVSRYYVPRLQVETSGGLNGSVLLRRDENSELYERMLDFSRRYNEVVGFRRGVTHLELFVEHRSGDLVFSEIASRLAGANVVEVIGAACGQDERTIWAHELLDGDPADLPLDDGRARYVGWLNLAPSRSGTIAALPDREALLAHPNVLEVSFRAALGDEVHVAGPSMWCVMLVLGAASEDELVKAAGELAERFPVEVG